jgi:hypothetical protein
MVHIQQSVFAFFTLILIFTSVALGSWLPSSQKQNLRRDRSSLFDGPILPNYDWMIGHDWIPAVLVANSSRSPCPMLNTLANHGFLSRDGKNITKDM